MADTAPNKAMILVVDDTPDNLALMNNLLKNDYIVRVANRGERALQLARSTPPQLILLDVMMPGLSGYDVCRALKSTPQTRDIPVIFLSAKNDAQDQQQGLALGAVDYLTKPVHPATLLARIAAHLPAPVDPEGARARPLHG